MNKKVDLGLKKQKKVAPFRFLANFWKKYQEGYEQAAKDTGLRFEIREGGLSTPDDDRMMHIVTQEPERYDFKPFWSRLRIVKRRLYHSDK